ncbi:hypothetical protein [Isobaculum melis]|uniref:Uncharacterized protein n=1 Tax=Isobaculum melis TaxID=142588 RepID=A0A1H9Q0W3_9LACT|nr:hypothetical protein [Isobaculum melis]SER54080.1 hypothetical protein SAMN04488559_101280 [Isobaculum melis]
MENQLLNFIETYRENIVIDSSNIFELEFNIALQEIKSIDFPEKSSDIDYSLLYRGSSVDETSVQDFIEKYEERLHFDTSDEKITIFITIKKAQLNFFSFTNFYVFSDVTNFIKCVNNLEIVSCEHKLIVLIIDDHIKFESEFIKIISSDFDNTNYSSLICNNAFEKYTTLNTLFKDRTLKNFLEYPLSWIDMSNGLDAFNVRSIQTFLSIVCNKILDTDHSSFLIRGYKTVCLSIENEPRISRDTVFSIEKLTNFIIDDKRIQDKLLILRNTMTLFLNSDENISGLDKSMKEIEMNVEYNFNTYIQDKIQLFFDQKNKLLLEFIATARKLEEQTNSIISQFRTVVLSLLGTIFLSLMNNITSAKTSAIVNIVLLSYLIFYVVNFFLVLNHKEEVNAILSSLRKYTKEISIDGKNNSFEELKKDYLDYPLSLYNCYRKWVIRFLLLLIVVFLSLFISNRIIELSFLKNFIKFIIGY